MKKRGKDTLEAVRDRDREGDRQTDRQADEHMNGWILCGVEAIPY